MKKIRFGIIGTNTISDKVIFGARQDPRFELAAVCSRTQSRADEFAAKHSIPYTFTSEQEMAASELIDAVYIASPNSLHARQSILFMDHGKHVLCEKTLAANLREVRAMVEASQRNKAVLMEAMKTTLTPNFLRIRESLSRIGKIRRYFSSFCQYSSRYDKLKEGTILNAFNPEFATGALSDIGVYTIYPMVVLFGKPQSIKASALKLHTGTDGQGTATFGYGDMDAVVIYSKIADSALPTEIQGEEGTITSDRINIISNVTFTPRGGQPEDISAQTLKDEYYYEVKEFIDVILSGNALESSVNTHENSMIVMEILDEIRRQTGIVYPADREI